MSSVGSSSANTWQASLFQAAGRCDQPQVRELIQDGRCHEDHFKDALRIALQKVAGRGHESLTRLLLEAGAEVNGASESEAPALFKAGELGKDNIVKLLLEYGADTEVRDKKSNRTPIFPAAQKNHRNTLSLLLQAGADVNARNGDHQTLMLCLASERSEKLMRWGPEVLGLLLATSLDLEAKDKDGRTALLWAAATGKESLAQLLLTSRRQHNANLKATNDRGKTALHLAAENNRVALVKLLLLHGADIHAQSDGGWTALHNAAERGHLDVTAVLLDWKANYNATTSSGMTALHWCARNGHIEIVKLLLKQDGIRRDRKDSFEETPMTGAAQNGYIEIVKLLSPADDGTLLSATAHGACKGFQATVVDFGMENRPMNHTKHSVFDLLYGWDDRKQKPAVTTVVRNIPAKPTFRWIHLPTNNMTWVEVLITKHFIENSASDVEGFKALEKSLGQQHRGPTVHSHFMRPMCQRMHPTTKASSNSELTDSITEKSGNEAESRIPAIVATSVLEDDPSRSSQALEHTSGNRPRPEEKKNKKAEKSVGPTTNGITTPKGNTPKKHSEGLRPDVKTRRSKQSERSRTPLGHKAERHGNIVLFMPYLHYETHRKRKLMSSAIERATKRPGFECRPDAGFTCDEMLIQAYLQSSHNLQIRRTLDQFYYHAISTDERDKDQVVYRYTRDKGKERKVFMVDQLWLWILSKDLIITSFPQRWDQPKNDPLNVLDGIIEDMNSKTRPPVKSVYDLAILITGRCSGVFDRHRLGDEDYQFLDMFESSIGEVTNKETELFKNFNDASVAAAQWLTDQRQYGKSLIIDVPSNDHDPQKDPTFVDTLLDIGEETALLAETKDIRDELNMISMVLEHQLSILDDLANALIEEVKDNHSQQKQAEVRKRFREQHKVIEVHLKDVERMDKQAEGIYTSLTHLLDLKQKYVNAFEARFARDQAAFIGRQGQTIMVFTIVTIVFLPMSFIAAVFAIPVRDFPHQDGNPSIPFSYVSKIMFGVGFAISIPLITVAFAVDNLGLLIKRTARRVVGFVRRDPTPGGGSAGSSRRRRNVGLFRRTGFRGKKTRKGSRSSGDDLYDDDDDGDTDRSEDEEEMRSTDRRKGRGFANAAARKSGESWRRRIGYDTDETSHIRTRGISISRDRRSRKSWSRDDSAQRTARVGQGGRDLEKGG